MPIIAKTIPVEEVKRFLDYDPETGVITQKVSTQGCKAGAVRGTINSEGYVRLSIKGKIFSAHRLAWVLYYGKWPDLNVDHIDGDRTNNAIRNLRVVTQSQNLQSRKGPAKGKKGGLPIGVFFYGKKGKYTAQIKYDGVVHLLGVFTSVEDAEEAYLAAKRLHHITPMSRPVETPPLDIWSVKWVQKRLF